MSKRKNRDSASVLLSRHADELERFATLLLESRDEAQDVLQDAFLRLSKLLETTEVQNSRALLFTIVGNLSRDILRRRTRWNHSEIPESLPSEDDPIANVLGGETAAQISRVIAALPPRCQQVFLLRKSQGLSYRQIAQQLSISEKTVENHLAAAMRALRQAILDNSTGGLAAAKRQVGKRSQSND